MELWAYSAYLWGAVALVVSSGHLGWSLREGRRRWLVGRVSGLAASDVPSEAERRRIAGVARALAVFALLAPGFLYLFLVFTPVLVLAPLAIAATTDLRRGRGGRRMIWSVHALAWIGVVCAFAPIGVATDSLGAHVAWPWPALGAVVLVLPGCLGFLVVARQCSVAGWCDREAQRELTRIEEDAHAEA